MYDALVIGAGQAGLAAGYHLHRAGLRFALLEAGAGPHGSWPHYYRSLTLFSPARYSGLPGLPFPGDPARYPTRAEVVAYLDRYAAHFGLPIIPQTHVTQVTRPDGAFVVTAASGRTYQARAIIAASGAFRRPALPAFPGQDAFGGPVLHAAAYQTPAPFAGQRVVVVGAGNSAVQIAVELAEVATVTLASRRPVRFRPQQPGAATFIFGCAGWASTLCRWAAGAPCRLPAGFSTPGATRRRWPPGGRMPGPCFAP